MHIARPVTGAPFGLPARATGRPVPPSKARTTTISANA